MRKHLVGAIAWMMLALACGLWVSPGFCQDEPPAAAAAEGENTPAAEGEKTPAAEEKTPAAEKAPAADDHGKAGADSHATGAEAHKHEAGDNHGGGAHHDDTDLSHANSTSMLTSPADARFDTAIYTFVIFLLLLIILGKFAWGPISQGLDKRERGIEEKIEEARIGAEKAAEQLRMYEARLAAAAEEARQIATQARVEAEAAKEQMLSEAKALAARERERAVADIAAAKNTALREIAEKSVNTAVNLAKDIVKREIKPNDHAQLIRDAMEKFPSAN